MPPRKPIHQPPGANQDILLRQDKARTWLPLVMAKGLTFTGPEREGYRPATIILVTGERTKGEIFVDRHIGGVTDLGNWNLPLRQVYFLAREAP